MKKLLLGSGTLASIVAPITTVVACGTTSDSITEGPSTPDNGNQNPGTDSSETQTGTPDTTQGTIDPSEAKTVTPDTTQAITGTSETQLGQPDTTQGATDSSETQTVTPDTTQGTIDPSEVKTVTPDLGQVTTGSSMTQTGTPTLTPIESVFAIEFKKEYPSETYDPSSTVATYLNTAQKENPEFYKDIPAIKAVLFWSDDAKVNAISDYVKYKEKYDELRKMILGETSVKEIVASEFGELKGSFPLYLSKVTSIGDTAFSGSGLTSLSLPSVISIGNSALLFSKFTSLNLPLVASIGNFAFWQSKFTSLSLPSVTSIGEFCWDHLSVPVPTNVDSSHPSFFAFPGNNDATKEEYDEYIKNNHI